MNARTDPSARVFSYHERTKHHAWRYARGPGGLDWANQPDPFRTYDGAPRFELALTADDVRTRYCDLYVEGAVTPFELGMDSLAAFFELALGLTAWKEFGGTRWALRSDPSSGNLHPTEGYVVLGETAGLSAGLYHYVSRDHCLEQRCKLDGGPARALTRELPAGAFIVGISSIHWREAWKYGERAFRYCQHDTGHVIATVRYAAAALGWSARLLDGLGDGLVTKMLGLDRDQDFARVDALDREHPDVALLVAPPGEPSAQGASEEFERAAGNVIELLSGGSWAGRANALSPSHVHWSVIDDVAEAACKPPSRGGSVARSSFPALRPQCETHATTIIRQRRSAVSLDGVTSISQQEFYSILDTVLPRRGVPPWDTLPWEPKIHLAIFLHRVRDLAPGLYLLERTAEVHEHFEAVLEGNFDWTRPPDCPEHLRLFRLREADHRRTAGNVSCHQDIAADGAFSLGMLAEFRDPILAGAFWYRRLFWEAGVLGQVLYLEAEAAGVRATGIGCYFDDAFHEVLGLKDERFQSLYHFTVGGFVEDLRLATFAPYEHLERE
jgi:SagB-type dehydrogenase family enzyme